MAKTLRISSRAQNDIEEILASVIEYTGFESSGIRLQDDIYQKFETIAYMPSAAGRLREDGTREAFTRRYRIVYTELENEVWIITIIHSSRLYPRI
ncbi:MULTISPECIES: type II toxin-antitoxin system RelE/ParE family toxin [unclassified Mannheimia]|uniref:type II toxin-antitoxin system RelE/ParE family toxin n=1 Tax=unclassified Mannheimia TaxID=2645054 RepID=UPI00359DDE21